MAGEQFLLELLAYQTGCTYISDLHNLRSFQKIRLIRMLEKLEAEERDLPVWQDALAYIAGKTSQGSSAEQIKKALIAALATSMEVV